jgi:hypothetical protein
LLGIRRRDLDGRDGAAIQRRGDGRPGVSIIFVRQTRLEAVNSVLRSFGSIAMKHIQTLFCSSTGAGGGTSLFVPARKRTM